ncbi:MAG: DUF58 domain-containing protein, partial [Nitrososphaerales archaeon]
VLGLFFVNPISFVSIPLVILLALMILKSGKPESEKIEVGRSLEKLQLNEHDACKVRLKVKNTGKNDIPILQIRDLVPHSLEGEHTQNGFTLELRSGESKDLFYELYCSTFGVFSIGPVNIAVTDRAGLFESEAVINIHSTLIVLPEIQERLSNFAIRPRRTKPWPGEIASRRTGQGMNYYSVRPLVSGEPLRRINWKASARSNELDHLFVNEFMAELGADALIIVDGREISEIGTRPDSTFSYSIRAALSIADRLLHDRNRVGLLTIGARRSTIPLGYGRRQFMRITLALLDLLPGHSPTLEGMVLKLRGFYPNVSQVVFVSPLIDEVSFSVAAGICRAGYDLIVISPNPLQFDITKPGKSWRREWKIAKELAQLERDTNIGELRSANALVIDWSKSEPLEEVIEAYGRVWAARFIRAGR